MKTSHINLLERGVLARLILGDDFLSTEVMSKTYGWKYPDEQVANFAQTLPDSRTLRWLKSNNSLLQAPPPIDCNLLQVRGLDNQVFYHKMKGWFTEPQHTFSREDVVKSGQWLMVRKGPYPGSTSEIWNEQQELLRDVEYVPNAPEMAYAVTSYYKVRGDCLLKGMDVRTSSVDADDHRIIVGGRFDWDGLDIDNYYDDIHHRCIGVASARKPS